MSKPINIDEPRWDQSKFLGRAKYYFATVNPINLFYSKETLERAKTTVEKYRKEHKIPENMTVKELYRLKDIYDSAYHPETGEKLFFIGRMSAQVPMNMIITGFMMTFYQSNTAVVFWQWINQSFNAVVNYSNRSGSSTITDRQLAAAYICATSGAVVTALGCKKLIKVISDNPRKFLRIPFPKSPEANPSSKHSDSSECLPNQRTLLSRLVPFAAVAAANCVNIPIMRYEELRDGISVYDEKNDFVGKSKKAAKSAIAAVVFSRVVMAIPSMTMTPIIMDRLEKKTFLKNNPVLIGPVGILVTGFILLFATPLACAIFTQRASMQIENLEPELKEKVKSKTEKVYYNKGL